MRTNPKILVISNYTNTVSVRPEAEIFIGLAKRGWEIEIMTYEGVDFIERFEAAGIKVITWHPTKKFDSAAVKFIRDRLIEGGHDIIQLFNSKASINGIRAAKGLPVKVVLYRGYQGNIKWFDPSMYLKYYHPRVNRVICNSIGVEEEFRKQLFWKKSKRFVTINKGHRLEWYADVQKADLSVYGVKPGQFTVTCVANTRRMKGVKYIMQALHLLPQNMDFKLLMVGRGLETPEYRKIADESAYGESVIFTGFQNNALEIDKASDAFLLASIFGESITKSVIEAMALGTTPLITDIPGNKYLVEHAKSGIVFPPKNPQALADAIYALYAKRSWCLEMGKAAQSRIGEKLNTEKTIAEYGALYLDLANGKGSYTTKPDVL